KTDDGAPHKGAPFSYGLIAAHKICCLRCPVALLSPVEPTKAGPARALVPGFLHVVRLSCIGKSTHGRAVMLFAATASFLRVQPLQAGFSRLVHISDYAASAAKKPRGYFSGGNFPASNE